MRAPKKLYWVELDTIGKLKYRQKGGGKYTSLRAAEEQQFVLLHGGIKSTIYESQDLQWTPVAEAAE